MRWQPGPLRLLRAVLIGLLAVSWTGLVVLALRTARSDHEQYLGRIGRDIDAQHAFLHRRLHRGGPLPMRTMLTLTFYGFSLVDSVLLAPDDAGRRRHAVAELRWILERLDDDTLRAKYVDTPPPGGGARRSVPHGVYYFGQRNLTLAGLLLIDPAPLERHVREFHANSQLLFDAFTESPIAHLESYPEHIWPADNVVALYSLAVHDRLYATSYRTAVERWIDFMSSRLDPETGLMPYKLDHRTGDPAVLPRGVTLAYSIAFLSDLAPELACGQYQAFRTHYHEWRFGLLGVREYPRHSAGPVDIDSGPIVLGIGAGASGFALAAARAMGDEPSYASLVLSAELLGAPFHWRGTRRYLLGAVPIVDAMIAWGKTRVGWLETPISWLEAKPREAGCETAPAPGRFSRGPLFALFALAAVLLAIPTCHLGRVLRGSTAHPRSAGEG